MIDFILVERAESSESTDIMASEDRDIFVPCKICQLKHEEEEKRLFAYFKTIEQRFEATEKLYDLRVRELDEKTKLAKDSMELRLQAMNEFRETLRDQAGRLLGRDEYVTEHSRLTHDINQIRDNFKDRFSECVAQNEFKLEAKTIHSELQLFRDFMISMRAIASQKSVYVTLIIAVAALLIALLDGIGHWMK